MRRHAAAALVTGCAALALPASAGAHSSIDARSPREGSVVSRQISVVRVAFTGRIADAQLMVRRRGATVGRGDGSVPRSHRSVSVRLRSGLRAGRYRATVRWMSTDGHIQSSAWVFRVR